MNKVWNRQYLGAGMPVGAAGDMSASFNGPAAATQGTNLSLYIGWSGTPVGTFALQCSYDGATWTTVPGASAEFTANSQAQPAGGASASVCNWSNVPGSSWRLAYTRTSGTGTATVYYTQR
jgi:hypothetical protein